MTTQDTDMNEILTHFRQWSVEEQLALVRTLIRELAAHEQSTIRQRSVYDIAGIARTATVIPSDEQIDAWLDERRMKEA